MDSSNIREQLSRSNPFFSGTAIDPWENDDPDVVSLNQGAYEHICGLIRDASLNPHNALAGLVLGESGMGKTHFLKRLLNYTRQNDITAVFASIGQLLDPQRPMRHLLNEIMNNLAKGESPSGTNEKISQLELLIAKIMYEYNKNNPEPEGLGSKILQVIASFILPKSFHRSSQYNAFAHYFQRSCVGVNENLLKAIFYYYRDPYKQDLILNWLKGRLHEDHVSVMNFPDRETMDNFALEQEAHDIIVSLGMLLKYCGMSMVICFDQLDAMKDQRLIDAFGHAVQVLVNEVKSMLPLVFIRTDTWTQRFSKLDPAVIGRLTGNIIRLWGCTVHQARELIKARIGHRFKNSGAEEKFQWLMKQLDGKLKENDSPREVIYLANCAITQVPDEVTEDDVIRVFNDEYEQKRDEAARNFGKWQLDQDHMLLVLLTYLKSRPEYDALKPGPDKYITLTGRRRELNGEEIDCAFIINTTVNNKTVQASFDRGVKFLRAYPNGHCFYISDERCFRDKTKWKKVHQVKDVFDKLNGSALFLTKPQAVSWYGLASLIFKLKNGDISLGLRAATEEDFELYMKKGFKDVNLSSKQIPGKH
ncbi:MAG: hypothetical protein FWG09_06965 [Synergistaceae bacterium]|nr:hypothetical protein [Synergistaceae bacterium]